MRFKSASTIISVSDKSVLKDSLDFIENTLKSNGVSKSVIIRTLLTVEEAASQLIEHADADAQLKINVRKMFGETEVILAAPGSMYDPYSEYPSDIKDIEGMEDKDVQGAIRDILLKARGESCKFSYKKGINRVRILVGDGEKSMLRSTIIALVLGVIAGFLMQNLIPASISDAIENYALIPLKSIFMSSLKIIIAPVVFFSIVSCISQFKDLSQLGRIGVKVMGMYMMTTIIAVVLAMGIFMLIKPATWGFAISLATEAEAVSVDTNVDTSLLNTIIGIVPSNFLQPFLDSDTLQIIFLAFLCGIAVGMIGEYSDSLKNFFEAGNTLFLTITTLITKLIPIAVFCAVSIMVKEMGKDSMIAVLGYMGTEILTIMCMLCIYGMLIVVLAHLNPFTFFKKNWEGMITSFTLSSSSAAMPTNMRTCTDKLGISNKVCSFSIPLGATVNMDGVSIFLVITSLFLARAYGIDIPANMYLSMAVTIILLSLGAPGVPGAGLVCLGVVLAAIGVPIEGIGIIIAVNPILDMFETMNNTTGDVVTALIVAKKEKLLDLEMYKK